MINAFKQIRLTNLGVSGANGRLNVNASGLAYYSELTGTSGVLQTNIASTGLTLQGQINSLSGTLTGGYATIPFVTGASGTLSDRLVQTGSNLDGKITNLSGTLTGNYATTSYVTGVSGALSTRLIQTGSDLNTRINNLSGTLTGEYATRAYVTGASGTLQTQIDNLGTSLSTSYVTLGTTQTITGNKTFNSTVYIKDLYVTGTQTIVNTQVTNVGSNYLNLNATGGARDGGLFINMSTGASTSGAYIGFDIPSNTFRIGTGVSGLADLSVLDTIATQAYVSNFVGTNIVYTTGAQTLSGAKTFDSAVSLNTQATTTSHAVRADRSITAGNGLTGGGNLTSDRDFGVGQGYGISVTADAVAVNTSEVVVTTGTQTISGSKTFSSAVTLSTQATSTGHAVAAARTITAGSGLAGGGDLTADRTLNIGQGYGVSVSADSVAVNTDQVVVMTGQQTIEGAKFFNTSVSVGFDSVAGGYTAYIGPSSFTFYQQKYNAGYSTWDGVPLIDFSSGQWFNINGDDQTSIQFFQKLITGFTNIAGTNIYKNGYPVLATNDTGNVASIQNLAQTGSTLQTQISSLSGTLTGNYVTTQFASATYATLVALNQKINWVSGQSQAFTVAVTTGVDTQSVSFPVSFTGGVVPTVQVTLDIPSNSEYMYNVAVRNVTTGGFTALYSDIVLETGIVLNVWTSKLYGSI